MDYWCIKKGLFFVVHPNSEMSQEIWVIGTSRRGYFSLFTLNLRCLKRYGLLVHQEGVSKHCHVLEGSKNCYGRAKLLSNIV